MNLFNQLSFKARLISVVMLATFICSTVSIVGFLYFNKKELHRGVVEKSRAIHLRLDAASHYVATQNGLAPVIERMKQKYQSSDQMTKEDKEIILKQVPIVAAMKIGAKDADKDYYEFRVFSDQPRNEGNQASQEEMVIFDKFLKDKSLVEHVSDNDESVIVYRPVRLKQEIGCFACHGDPKTSPWGNGKDILGYTMENWEDGKLHGVFAVKTDLKKLAAAQATSNSASPGAILIAAIIVGAIFAVGIAVVMIKKPIEKLNKIASGLNSSGEQLNSASSEIASTSSQLSQASTEQAASLEETSSSIEEISSMINANTENAKNSARTSEQSLGTAERGKVVVDRMIEAIEEINVSNVGIMEQIDETNKEIENIVKIINEIGAKTKVINDIVFQTKLLSFNASVEAARAGEQGKGFSVVAEEVGNLAAMSGNAAQEITNMLEDSIKTVEEIVKKSKDKIGRLVQNGKEKVDTGTRVAHECEEVLNEIVSSVASVSKMVSDISSAGQEQALGVQEITKAIAQLDQVNHQNSASAAESANAATKLSSEAEELNLLVHSLVQIIDGES